MDIGKARAIESRRRSDETRVNALIRQIDELLWELEKLNLQDRRLVPAELLPRITMVVAEATEADPPPTHEVSQALVPLPRLYNTQRRLTKLNAHPHTFPFFDLLPPYH